MFGINATANSAVLASLRQIGNDLQVTQTRIGTGKKINSAADNPSVWSTVTSLKGDIAANDAISSTISLAKAKVDANSASLTQVNDLLTQMKTASDTFTSSAKSASDLSTAQAKIGALQTQIISLITNATFQGTNLLTTASSSPFTVSVGSDSNGAAVTLSLTPTKLNDSTTPSATYSAYNAALVDTTVSGVTTTAATNVSAVSGLVATALTEVTGYQAKLQTFSSVLGSQQDYIKTIQSIRQNAISGLVDADLSAESAKVTALQTQQQLAYQALSMGNSSASGILRLFQ